MRLADPGPAAYHLWGKLCQRRGSAPRAVQVLQPGGTYNHTYWDSTYRGGILSYVNAATAAGYATFTFDRIGTGNSTIPPYDVMSLDGEAVALHDVVTALRSGALGHRSFSHVISVGHSFSSGVAAAEAARYDDVDGLIDTSLAHAESDAAAAFLPTANYEAGLDPKFAGRGLDGYLTTIPGERGFYHSPKTSNADIIALDEANKDIHSGAEGPEIAAFAQPPTPAEAITQRVTVPVLLMLGGDDNLSCGAGAIDCSSAGNVRAHEAPYWHGSAANVTFTVLPGVGHSIQLSTAEPVAAAIMLAWSWRIARP
ncbi:alpha/beta hydrolase [Rugosimonospora acidiphila]|uniref:alpha/beta hydrolase n=1 Tax=Rugosimonospora acidiphila TaxID=556531 RepID=UPI0031E97E97